MALDQKQHIRAQVFKFLKFVLFFGFVILAIKLLAYFLTGSLAIFSDALESIANIVGASVALIAWKIGQKPKDEDHPYGHGKIEFISSGIEGAIVLFAGISIAVKAVLSFWQPYTIEKLPLGLIIVSIAGLGNGIMGLLLKRKGKTLQSPLLMGSGGHLISDFYSSVGLVAGVGLIHATGWVWLDPIIALIISGLILKEAFHILRRAFAGVMDETDFEKVKELTAFLSKHRKDSWIDIHNLRIIHYGQVLHVDAHMTMPWYWTVEESHEELERINDLMDEFAGDKVELFIHVDPCIPESCRLCKLACDKRQHEFVAQQKWTVDNIIMNRKHQLYNGET